MCHHCGVVVSELSRFKLLFVLVATGNTSTCSVYVYVHGCTESHVFLETCNKPMLTYVTDCIIYRDLDVQR